MHNSDGNELTDPISPQVDALDSVYPQDPAFKRAAAGGVTTVQDPYQEAGTLIGGKAVTLACNCLMQLQLMIWFFVKHRVE